MVLVRIMRTFHFVKYLMVFYTMQLALIKLIVFRW